MYVHLRHEGQDYTVKCRWDAVLDHGEPSNEALRMALEEAARFAKRAVRVGGVDGVLRKHLRLGGEVKHPRGTRRKEVEGPTVPGTTDGEEGVPESEGSEEDQGSEGESEEAEEIFEEEGGDGGEDIAPEGDGVRRIFRGKLEDALEIPVVERAFDVQKEMFGGHYITSNPAESLFDIKAALRAHRTVKSGDAFLQLFLFLGEKVRRWSGSEIRSVFRDEVATFERIRDVAVGQKGVFTNDPDSERMMIDAHRSDKPVVICYKDRKGRRTIRMIEPLGVEMDTYTEMKKIEAYCYLREDRRTFLADRIVNAIPADTNLSIISPNSI